MLGLTRKRPIQIHDVQLLPTLLRPIFRLRRRIIPIHRHIVHTTLPQAHTLAILQVNRR
jgi:hypothetical protein